MKKEEKANVDLDIMSLINSLVDKDNEQDGIMYLRGDKEFNQATVVIKGDVNLLAQSIQHHLDNNEEFKRFILAVVGSWLSKNPTEETIFYEGVGLTKKSMEAN